MLIAGFEKNSLLDYPGKVASIIFTYGCNLTCGYCHNPELVISPCNKESLIPDTEVLEYLKKRKGLVDALVITGGEPLIQPNLLEFIRKVKDIGVLVKLDTNGVMPDLIEEYISLDLVDYWAMDVKYPKNYYKDLNISKDSIERSISLIMNSQKEYEFRTTYVKGIHTLDDVDQIGEMIKGAKNYYIQNFRKGKTIDPTLNNSNSFTQKELEQIKEVLSKYIDNVNIR